MHHGSRPEGVRDGHHVFPRAAPTLDAGPQFLHRPKGGRDIGELAGENLVPTGREFWADRRIGSLRQAVAPQLKRRRGARVEAVGRPEMSPDRAATYQEYEAPHTQGIHLSSNLSVQTIVSCVNMSLRARLPAH